MTAPLDNLTPAQQLRWVDDELKLHRRAILYVNQYPDIHDFACQCAKGLLKKLAGVTLDPTQVYWHRFDNGVSSPRTFTGYEHFGPPIESLTLVDLLIKRFSVSDQDNSDELRVYQGFYIASASAGVFDERHEVRLLPDQVLAAFWAMDFKARYLARVESFWAVHSPTFRLLTKTHRLAEIIRQRKNESQQSYLARLRTEAPELSAPVSLEQLQEAASKDASIEAALVAAKTQMLAEANTLITANADLRKQLWRGYLGAFIRVFGVFAPLAWPAALTAVGAGVARVGLDIDQAVRGHSAGLRKQGVVDAVLDGIFVLFNAPLLRSATLETNALGEVIALDDAPTPNPAQDLPINRGVQYSPSGSPFITLDGVEYVVQYRGQMQQWCIVDPANPYGFYGFKPVYYDVDARLWRKGSPLRLAGGMEQSALGDPFWDQYMRTDHTEQMRLSRRAMERQRECLQHLMVAPETHIDDEGEYTDRLGLVHSVYQSEDGEFRALQIARYTDEPDAYNSILRYDPPSDTYAMSVERVQLLADEVQLIGSNNSVDLFRAGSGVRGTSGQFFRDGRIEVGDLLVNTDITSFSENPYVTAEFASSLGGGEPGPTRPMLFDDTSVVFVLRAGDYQGATPIAPFSELGRESESIMLPGHFFQVQGIQEVTGAAYRFMRVDLQEVTGRQAGKNVFELRTGLPYSAEVHASRLSPAAQALVTRFFNPQ